MAVAQVWYQVFGEAGEVLADRLSPDLSALGLYLRPREVRGTADSADVVLVFCGDADPDAVEFVRSTALGIGQRLLVIGQRSGVAWAFLAAGAADYFNVPDRLDEVLVAEVAGQISRFSRRWCHLEELLGSPRIREVCIGSSPIWRNLLREAVDVAQFAEVNVLLAGESGTGKELVAKVIHEMDARPKKGPLVVVDCTTISPELSGSEFFGHVRGAFTGAHTDRPGAFELAHGGTLFLDEVGELPLPLQAELLRVVQERTFKRVGSNAWQSADIRLICATNRALLQEVESGGFRRDLYYRLAGWVCHLPPLRERINDVVDLLNQFLKAQLGLTPALPPEVRHLVLSYPYPGNVREMKQFAARIALRYPGVGPITPGCLPVELRPLPQLPNTSWSDGGFEQGIQRAVREGTVLTEIARCAEQIAIDSALNEAEGNVPRAARQLGLSPRTLQLRLAAQRSLKEEPTISRDV